MKLLVVILDGKPSFDVVNGYWYVPYGAWGHYVDFGATDIFLVA